jgi:riboflavin synthase
MRLVVRSTLDLGSMRVGDSVAVQGACLTVAAPPSGQEFCADVSFETLDRSTLGHVRAGTRVHLERALPLGGRLDGHLVQGHIDATASVVSLDRRGPAWELALRLPSELAPFVVEKGSVAIDGVSLTVNACSPGALTVAIVPHTGSKTLLTELRPGQLVNVETDILGKYVVNALRLAGGTKGGLTREALAKNGFHR